MPSVEELWSTYEQVRAQDGQAAEHCREQLIVHYAPLVRYVAFKLRAGVPARVDPADLASSGLVGLIGAVEAYRPDAGTAFESYAVPRIRGAILDELRGLDWVPRSLRRRAREIDAATTDLSSRTGTMPTDDEVASELGTTPAALHETLGQIAFADVVSLSVGDDPMHGAVEDPLEEIERWDSHVALVRAVHRLPVRERIVVALYYYESFTLAQIGSVLGVGESRVSQLHSAAVRRLRPWVLAEAG